VKTGDTLDLYVIALKGGQAFLSPNPGEKNLADNLVEAFQNNLTVEGKVLSSNKGGFTVSILNKEAFCPISQMDNKRIEKPEEYLGKRFEFKITQLDPRNVVVSRRRLLEAEQSQTQAQFSQSAKVGDVISGEVSRLEKFGAFIKIAPGIDGLAHISELSWSRIKDPGEILELGAPVSARILRIEHEDGRLKISLTLKQSENEPWNNLPSHIVSGALVSGKVTRCLNFGAFVEVAPGIEGLIPLSEMSAEKRVSRSDEVIKEGEKVSVVVREVNIQAKRLSLSLKAAKETPSAEDAQDLKDFQAKQSQKNAGASFGSLAAKLQAAMDKNKK
jgi:small subunit ribosomal protein S1